MPTSSESKPPDGRQGTDLCWTLLVDEPTPEPTLLGHLCQRLNQLINANLRYTFGQQIRRVDHSTKMVARVTNSVAHNGVTACE